jgi:hypothetical protein
VKCVIFILFPDFIFFHSIDPIWLFPHIFIAMPLIPTVTFFSSFSAA